MVCLSQVTIRYVRAEEQPSLRRLQQELRKALLGEEFPVLIDYAGLPVHIKDLDSAAQQIYRLIYHVHMRLKLLPILAKLPPNGLNEIATITAISERSLAGLVRGYLPLTLLELHRVNHYIGWHNWAVKFVPTAERRLGNVDFKDPDLFI